MKKATAIILILLVLAMTGGQVRPREWQYTRMGAQVNYSVGERVEYDGGIYECIKWDPSDPAVMVPPSNSTWWAEVSE